MGNFDNFSRTQNQYFNFNSEAYNNDKSLIAVMINEVYNKYGVCMEYYITTYDTNYDRIFGEDNNRRYMRNFKFNGYFNTPKEDKMWSKFGIEGTDEVIIWVSKRHFEVASVDSVSGISYMRPQIGDVLKSEYNTYFYEIVEVAEDSGQYLQSNQYIWELTVRPMKDEFIDIADGCKNSDIVNVTNINDIFNIDNNIDVEKENVVYKPIRGEKPKNDPFANW